MSDVKLEPGWLVRDVQKATNQTSSWNSSKNQSTKTPSANSPDTQGDDKQKKATESS
ncbi:hypothetical protein [Bradyrhizobium sp.]|uniref:hypothetical protein n=1 Tax=Bradyrhizobium sp. TaxID=376 RepID=UPI00261F3A3C|nr:hypothetical protein [Bradyrhizobium sp.]